MNFTTLLAAAAIGAGLAFVAPSADAMPRGLAPVDTAQTGHVQKVHGCHTRRIRGHRSYCRKRHSHKHCHNRRCHRHSHYDNHHHHNSYRNTCGVTIRKKGFSIGLGC